MIAQFRQVALVMLMLIPTACKLARYSYTFDETPEGDCIVDKERASLDWDEAQFVEELIQHCAAIPMSDGHTLYLQSGRDGALLTAELRGDEQQPWHGLKFGYLNSLSSDPPQFVQSLGPKVSELETFYLEITFFPFGNSCEKVVAKVYKLPSIETPKEQAERVLQGLCRHYF